MTKPKSVSVVLPAYNEQDNIVATVEKIASTIPAIISDWKIIAVNDGSRDATGTRLSELQKKIPQLEVVTHERNKGYGAAVKSGLRAARTSHAFFMDSDGQFDIGELPRVLNALDQWDIVTGFRANRRDPFIRKLNALLYNTVVVRGLFKTRVRDVNCAFKVYPTTFIEACEPILSDGALINAEMFLKAKRLGLSVGEVPVTHYPRQFGVQTGANIKVIIKMFTEAFKLWYRLRSQTARP
jgi:glycosyltransferase involved in cell wall biosynthesis